MLKKSKTFVNEIYALVDGVLVIASFIGNSTTNELTIGNQKKS